MNEEEAEEAVQELLKEGLVEEVPRLTLDVKRKTTVSINAEIQIGNDTLRVKDQKGGIKLEYSKRVNVGYYRRNQAETQYVVIPVELVPYALEALQAVIDAKIENAE